MFRFAEPKYFYLLALIPVVILLFWLLQKQAQRRLKIFLGERLQGFLTSSVSKRKRKVKLALNTLVILFLIIALARPQGGSSKEEVKSEGVELMILFDVSESMMAEDVRPNRLEQAKAEMNKLIDMLGGNKVGLVAFAGTAVTLSPLTTDVSALKMFIDSMSPYSVSTQGTSFREAFNEARAAFERGGIAKEEARATRVILVVSDGEDQEPGALETARKFVDEGVRIFALAYGTEKGAPIPVRDKMGMLRSYKKDSSGNTVLSTVRGAALRELAKAGQGSFFHAAFGGSHLQNLKEDFDRLEKTQFQSEMTMQYSEWFQVFLLVAFALGVIEILLGEQNPPFRLWKGRFEVPPA